MDIVQNKETAEQKQKETKTQKEAKRIEHLVQQAPAAEYGGAERSIGGSSNVSKPTCKFRHILEGIIGSFYVT
jgi:hypothetical protein